MDPFKKKRFDMKALTEYGFDHKGDGYQFEKAIMDGDLICEVTVFDDGRSDSRVRDSESGEEYVPIKIEGAAGEYVGAARREFEELLQDIADKCCHSTAFDSEQANRIAGWILDEYSVKPDFPWKDKRNSDAGVFRHLKSRKWFGLIMNIKRSLLDGGDTSHVDVMNLKADEDAIPELIARTGIFPAYHMNKKNWISVLLDETLTDDEVEDLVRKSFDLTALKYNLIEDGLIQKVLDIADNIPFGRVASYGKIAEMAGRPRNSRLVGRIMSMADRYGEHPCHRVVNHAGRLVPGWEEQRGLLEAEGIGFKKNGCVDMDKYSI